MNATLAILLVLLAGVSPAEVRRAADAVSGDGDYQTELPGESRLGTEGRVGPDVPPEEVRRGEPPAGGPHLRLPNAGPLARLLGTVMEHIVLVLIGVLVVVAVVLGLSWAVGAARERARRRELAREEDPAAAPGGPVPEIGDPAALAREGRFADAIHTLLLRSQAELMRRVARPFSPAMTSREILARGRVPEGAASHLEALVRAVERVLFGGREAGRPDYERCAGHFEGFLAALPEGAG